jgi:alpha-glucosidase (family GH31 glycosyl hydrolase)
MKKQLLFLLLLVSIFSDSFAQKVTKPLIIPLEKGEKIWSGSIKAGHKMPFDDGYKFDFYANNEYNQIQPLLLSNKGRYLWSEEPFAFELKDNKLIISNMIGEIKTGKSGTTLAEAQRFATKTFFPASGKAPDSLLFARPQYNTWIELTYNHNQADILKYAHAIVDNGMPTGVFMIDASWQEAYGIWKFHPGRFPNPKAMIKELHDLGFKVMVWMCPFISPDQPVMREMTEKKLLLMNKQKPSDTYETAKEPAIIKWWDGYSAELDFTNPDAVKWFNGELDRIVQEYDVDGFKFDAADSEFYPENVLSKFPATSNRHTELYAQFGLRFPLNEYRACWKMAGQPLAQRLHDKGHSWEDLNKLVPHMLTEGLVGYTFSCPDMIGGGEWLAFRNRTSLDEDLVVRSAQCHALMPMMQFSAAPWRVLDKAHFDAVKKSIEMRTKFTPLIMSLMRESARTGEPIMKNLEFVFPNQGLEQVKDQFMMGSNLLVAPMVEKGTGDRRVVLPKGKWKADDGKIYEGGNTITVNVPLDRLPYFEKI